MKILCVSDEVDPIVYSPRIKERFGDVEFVIAAGDLPMDYLEFIVSMLNKPLLFVQGNHDLPLGSNEMPGLRVFGGGSEPGASGAVDIGFRLVREAGLIILGLPGSIRYNGTRNQFTDAEMFFRLSLLLPCLLFNRIFRGRAIDLVVTHAPPRAINDREDPCHRGFRAYAWLIRRFKPRWFVHGHVHLYDLSEKRICKAGDTSVINAFGHWIIDTEDGKQ
jgi:hypothetical protein